MVFEAALAVGSVIDIPMTVTVYDML